MPQERLVLRATMIAHNDWVTAIATPSDNSDIFVTSSHDKSLILWTVTKEDKTTWLPRRRLTGHSHFVEDVALSSDGKFALSGSWDGEVRLWDLQAGTTVRQFVGRTKDVWSVSRSQDKTVKIRYSGNCKIRDKLMGHGGYVNTVAVCPDGSLFASGGEDGVILLWDLQKGKMEYSLESNSIIHSLCFSSKKYMLCAATEAGIKVWDLASKRIVIDFSRTTLIGHRGYVNTVAVSPDGLLCASGGEDGEILFWDFLVGRKLHSLESNSRIHSLCFCPNKFWVCAATEVGIMIWDLESKNIVVDLRVPKQEGEMTAFGEQSTESKNKVVYCTSLSWSADGSTLFSGYTDGVIRVWAVVDC